MKKAFSKVEAIAHHTGLEYSEVKDCRYHFGHTTKPIYAVGETYITCTRIGEKPGQGRWRTLKWVEVADSFVNQNGYKIYKATEFEGQ
jgi:hypothetical protein